MNSTSLLKRVVLRTVPKRNYAGLDLKASYNDLPSPQGSWQTSYDANQRKYNAHLAFGTLFLIGSIVFARAGGFLNLNYNPPAKPSD
ncbi:Deltamethrin resistance [Popillia japonica]|uniref:Deltamethrin resistance n=1 Tax=Popillia japonica TaxID=7064 RepID=A0AAW1MHD4_POPJA